MFETSDPEAASSLQAEYIDPVQSDVDRGDSMSAQAQIGMFIEAGKMLLSVWPIGNYVVMGLYTLEASTGYSLALEKLTPSQCALIGGLAAAGMIPFGRVGASALKGGAKVVGPLAKGAGLVDDAVRVGARAGGKRVIQIGEYTYAQGAAKHWDDLVQKGSKKGELVRPYMRSYQTIKEIMAGSKPKLDPQGAAGAIQWLTEGFCQGSKGVYDLVIHPETKIIYHFLFRSFPK